MSVTIDWITLGGIFAMLVFQWGIYRDMRTLSDRVSRLEGRLSGIETQIASLSDHVSRLEGRLSGVESVIGIRFRTPELNREMA